MKELSKSEIRTLSLEKRRNMNLQLKKECDLDILSRLLLLKEYRNSKLVLTYCSKNTEIDTLKFIEASFLNSKKVAVPLCYENNTMDFYYIDSVSQLTPGSFGVLEPSKEFVKVTDFQDAICITPSLSVDMKGYRVGYGKGYYDKFFSENSGMIKIALSYYNDVLMNIQSDDYDIPVDIIVTDKFVRYIK